MSEQVIQMSYPDMEAMSKAFKQGSETLTRTRSEVQTLAGQLSDGALLGQGGTTLTEALQGSLSPALEKLTAKIDELIGDIGVAVKEMQAADQESKSKF